MSAIAATDRLIEGSPDKAAGAVRAIVKTLAALKADPGRAAEVGRKLFPPSEAELIAELIRRDVPFYDASIPREAVAGMGQFARDLGILREPLSYEQVVATQFANMWG
jgi:NitT/TauT family transport system substrate-binding protein